MWSLVNQDLNRSRKSQRGSPLKLHRKVPHSEGKIRRRAPGLTRLVWQVLKPIWPVPLEVQCSGSTSSEKRTGLHRPVWLVPLGALEKTPEAPRRKEGRVSRNPWPNMRRKELIRSTRINQIKLRIQNHHRIIMNNWLLIYNKVIMLLHHIYLVSRLLHGSGRILTITHLWIIVECIYIHTLFNILLRIQVMVPLEGRLLLVIIWSRANPIAAKMVGRIWGKTTSIYSQGGVP